MMRLLPGFSSANSLARRIGAFAVAVLLAASPAARANELGGNVGWQFPDPA